MTKNNNRMSKRSPSENSIVMVKQKVDTMNQTNDCNEHLQVKMIGQNDKLCYSLCHTTASTMIFLFF